MTEKGLPAAFTASSTSSHPVSKVRLRASLLFPRLAHPCVRKKACCQATNTLLGSRGLSSYSDIFGLKVSTPVGHAVPHSLTTLAGRSLFAVCECNDADGGTLQEITSISSLFTILAGSLEIQFKHHTQKDALQGLQQPSSLAHPSTHAARQPASHCAGSFMSALAMGMPMNIREKISRSLLLPGWLGTTSWFT